MKLNKQKLGDANEIIYARKRTRAIIQIINQPRVRYTGQHNI